MKKEFDQQKYINEFNKGNYSQFNVRLTKDEKKELDELLSLAKLKSSDFIRISIKKLKEDLKNGKQY